MCINCCGSHNLNPSSNNRYQSPSHSGFNNSSSNHSLKRFEPLSGNNSINQLNQSHELSCLLAKQLGPEFLSTRSGAGGCKLTYVEGWRVIALANEIFGHDGWSSETKSIEVDFIDPTPEGKFNVGVSAVVRIWLRTGSSHEDVGYGKIENCKSKADAMDKCKKEAVTDALKRTMRMFGNLLGNCLYDKTYLHNIKNLRPQKEKFLPSKLYRVEHMTKNLPSGGAQLIENESVEQKATAKDTAQTYEAEELPSKPLKQPIKSESAVKREDTFLPPAPKISVPDSRITNKENQFGRENSELQPPPPTFSDSYFDMDETDLAQLDGMDNSEGVNNTLGGNTSISEDSCMITEASIRMSSSVCGGIHQVGSSKILNGDLKKPQNSEGLRFLKEFNEKLPDGLNEARPQSGSGWQNITNLQNNQFNSLGCGRFNGSAANFPVKGLPGIRGSSMILKDETGSFKTPTPLKPPQTNTRPLHEPFSRFSALRTNESNSSACNRLQRQSCSSKVPPIQGSRRPLSEVGIGSEESNNHYNCPSKKIRAEG